MYYLICVWTFFMNILYASMKTQTYGHGLKCCKANTNNVLILILLLSDLRGKHRLSIEGINK